MTPNIYSAKIITIINFVPLPGSLENYLHRYKSIRFIFAAQAIKSKF
jgi:hypothetical protein